MSSDQPRARKGLYEASGGYLVDGLPPDPSLKPYSSQRALRESNSLRRFWSGEDGLLAGTTT
eukprot:1814075-Pyramimonas_sp.AAC.1